MRIQHLRLYTLAIEAQHHFYTFVLELPETSRSSAAFSVQVGESTLEFIQAEGDFHYHFAFNIPSNALNDAKSWLEFRTPLRKGGAPDIAGKDLFESVNWEARQVYFRDPAGNIGELIAHRTRPASTAQTFGPSSLLEISEIGLVTDNVLEKVRTLEIQFELEPYRQDADPQFTAVGSVTGFFIVVKTGRKWFPDLTQTAVPAKFEVQMALEGGESVWTDDTLEREVLPPTTAVVSPKAVPSVVAPNEKPPLTCLEKLPSFLKVR